MSKEQTPEEIYRFYKGLRNGFLIVAIPMWIIAALAKHHTYAVYWLTGAVLTTGLGIILLIILHFDSKPFPEEQERR